jgi:hypothetical protein
MRYISISSKQPAAKMLPFPTFPVDPYNPIRIHHYANFRINGERHRLFFYDDKHLLMKGDGYDHQMYIVPESASILTLMSEMNTKNATSPILIDSWCTDQTRLPFNSDIFADRMYLLESPIRTLKKDYDGFNATIRTTWS